MNNDSKLNDRQYMFIVEDILENDEFNKMDSIVHHGLDRKSHCLRVSYYSYKISKALRLDYKSVARAGLLHDFFLDNNQELNIKDRTKTLIKHPKYALEKANEMFELNDKEKDIILSHMFPISLIPSRYLEGWLVNIVDDIVALYEIGFKTKSKISYATNLALLFIFTYLR